MIEGGAGYVYQATLGDSKYAFKVFKKHAPDRRERYKQIHVHLENARSPAFVDFRFADRGVWASPEDGSPGWFPALRMEWCRGETLDVALESEVRGDYDRDAWARAWLKLLAELRRTRTAHGDLQHGNVIVERNREMRLIEMRLIDYDGMFIPSMKGQLGAVESGHVAYQHPARQVDGRSWFDEHIDGISGLVILTSLAGLTRELWEVRDSEGAASRQGRSARAWHFGHARRPQSLARADSQCSSISSDERLTRDSARARSSRRRPACTRSRCHGWTVPGGEPAARGRRGG